MAKKVGGTIVWIAVLALSLGLLAYRLLKLSRGESDVPIWVPHVSLCMIAAIIAIVMLRRHQPA